MNEPAKLRKVLDEQLIHIRRKDKEGKLLSTGGATIIIKRTNIPHHFVVDVAQCCEKDVFCRRIGKAIATGRAEKYAEITTGESIRSLINYYSKKLTGQLPAWYPSILDQDEHRHSVK